MSTKDRTPTEPPAPEPVRGTGMLMPDPDQPRPHYFRAGIGAIFQATRWVILLPFAWRRRRRVDEVTVYSAHPGFYLWVLILTGFVAGPLVSSHPNLAEAAGWVYIAVTFYFIVTVLYDFSTRKFLLWLGIFALIWLGSKYIEHVRNVAALGVVVNYLRDLRPTLDPGTVTVLSWLLLVPWIGSLGDMVLNGRKKFTPNEIGEFHFGEGSELTDRTGLRFRTRYRDVLETLLSFGGGDILAVDNHQNEIKRYPNIIGLFFVWNRLDRILHLRAASIEDGDEEVH
ncbi:MAG TPA: hypothetical protein VHV55_27790 [Pirellulales bacterium]|jgi:hypothetical protein|nr:hypothetical protein [Pirellulales bacterium]